MKKIAAVVTAVVLFLSLTVIYGKSSSRRPDQEVNTAGSASIKTAGPETTPVSVTKETATITPALAATTGNPAKIIYQNKVVVLIYHHIDYQEVPGLVISPQRFRHHLDMLREKGYRVISLDQLRDFLNGGPIPDNAVLITFDDGYESVYQYALPELRERQMPAVSFAIAGYAGQKLGHLQHYGWEEAREMAAAGFITQSHTYNLHSYGLLANGHQGPLLSGPLKDQSPDDFMNMVYQDLARSREEIEAHLQQPVCALALPYGAASHLAIQAAVRAGFNFIFTTQAGAIAQKSNPLALPRINAGSPAISASALDIMIRKAAGVETPALTKPQAQTRITGKKVKKGI
ncbi:polysaccharide deacetylase family protein [Neomoorella mulderi]|uniref:Poly-beta-1,6-N-acetyl-D-glucosamine N-deacetylase n=1 Tax=Moorella mulderi DSM 14980 TaxID=1122241 RepID=A0A151AUD7_9FIRM|nr:polysaccharide deacetylase family protein [Moorella mulderi]KYH31266.1 poly-beta-1,6-N-acetyl-D-glucosamine N-deacetylase precursor [Moorella mulderi DSM 14980]